MYETLKSAIPAITARQREVVELIAEGCSNEEIGERLGISPRTAKAHSDILRQKLTRRGTLGDSSERIGSFMRFLLRRFACHFLSVPGSTCQRLAKEPGR
jgi:DNA-binding CsgD family transcriptional regulator